MVWVFGGSCPRTGVVHFDAQLGRYVDEATRGALAEVTRLRNDVQASLGVVPNPAAAVVAIEKYLPHLLGLKQATAALPADICKHIVVAWNTAFSSQYCNSAVSIPSLNYELVMILFAYGISQRLLARDMSRQTGALDDETKSTLIANLLCKAAGVFNYISTLSLSSWTQGLKFAEVTTDLHLMLSSLCLLEAQEIAIRKGIARKTSPGVIAKLALGVVSKAKYCEQIVKSLAPPSTQEIRLQILGYYLSVIATVFKAQAYSHLSQSVKEQGKYGIAVSYLEGAQPTATEQQVMSDRRTKEFMPEVLTLAQSFLTTISKAYELEVKDNQTVYFEPVPNPGTLEIPDGITLVKPVAFVCPAPATIPFNLREPAACTLL
ncbi:BRO1-like domain [Pelomyxa schiedti]|nr:BRO1-like domain [Pelomyxa schiedti]